MYDTIGLGSTEYMKQDKYEKIIHLGLLYSNCRNKNKKENLERCQMGASLLKSPYL